MYIAETFKTFCSVKVEKLNLIRPSNLYLLAVLNYEIARIYQTNKEPKFFYILAKNFLAYSFINWFG